MDPLTRGNQRGGGAPRPQPPSRQSEQGLARWAGKGQSGTPFLQHSGKFLGCWKTSPTAWSGSDLLGLQDGYLPLGRGAARPAAEPLISAARELPCLPMAVAELYTKVGGRTRPKGGRVGGQRPGASADCTWRPGHTCAPGVLASGRGCRGTAGRGASPPRELQPLTVGKAPSSPPLPGQPESPRAGKTSARGCCSGPELLGF